ncbi:MAG: putative peroxidase-related enzyme [Candidatus Pseudothioglobus sp.]|jgi:uncharacterized peroxidase-related enzyme
MPDMPQDEAFSSVSPRFPLPDINALPDDIKQRIVDVQAKSGFVPNVFLVYARRPAEFRAFFAYHDALMDSDVGLTRAEREMIVVATSGANRCLYCVVAHGAILRIRAKDEQIAEQLAVNYRKANISPRQLAMLDLAMKVSADAANVTEEDFTVLQAHGFDNNAIWDICAITAFFGLSNRMANVTSMQPNMEFYALGRDLGRR